MTQLHRITGPGDSATGDVVFVHGLAGHPLTTWGLDSQPSWSTWLSDDRPELNLWSLEYDIEASARTGGAMPLADRATNALAMLSGSGLGARPVCFIAHSMGGLLVKQLLRHASSIAKEYLALCSSTRGVVLFSTPHAGSDVTTLVSYLGFVLRLTVAVEELRAHEPRLRELNLWFRNNASDLGIASKVFYETQPTGGVVVVNATSADPGIPGVTPIPVDTDHFVVCRPASREDLRYLQTLQFLRERIPTVVTDPVNAIEASVSALRQGLLVAESNRGLRRLLYEAEALASRTPQNADALMIRDDIRTALERDNRSVMSTPVSSPVSYRMGRAYSFNAGGGIGNLIFLVIVIYGLYRLVSWVFHWWAG